MENKYYTPTIEEFHVGFNYELRMDCDLGTSETDSYTVLHSYTEWVDQKFNLNKYDVVKKSLNLDKIRVKYLDREDIESLGFKFIEINCYDQIEYKYSDIILIYCGGNNYMIKKSSKNLEYFECALFNGVIKNKSELKVLLKQLNAL